MVPVKDLTELTLADLWRGVKEQFWEDVNTETLRLVRRLLEDALEEELVAHLQAFWYQRNPDRKGCRERDLFTRWGLVEHLRVPRDRDGHCQPQVREHYQRRQEEVNVAVRELLLRGISTRQVEAAVQLLAGGRSECPNRLPHLSWPRWHSCATASSERELRLS